MISDAAAMMHVESHVLRYWEEELELDVPRNEMGTVTIQKKISINLNRLRNGKKKVISSKPSK